LGKNQNYSVTKRRENKTWYKRVLSMAEMELSKSVQWWLIAIAQADKKIKKMRVNAHNVSTVFGCKFATEMW
jgi:hypothetical protein